jgi:hypothetical protein
MSLYGPIVTGYDLELAVLDTLRRYFRADLADFERSLERGARSIEYPRSWTTATTLDRWPETQLPAIVVVSTGLAEPPEYGAGGLSPLSGWWDVAVAAITSASDGEAAARLSKWYAAIARRVLLQHGDLGGLAAGVRMTDESYDLVPFEDGRVHAGAEVGFAVRVEDFTDPRAGVLEPPEDPYADPGDEPSVDDVIVTVERVESTTHP